MKKILPFFLFLALIPSVLAQETNKIPSGIGYTIGIAFGAVILFFLVDYSLNIEINEKFIGEAIVVFIGAIVSVSIVSGSLYATPQTPFYHAICENNICDPNLEYFNCPQDCGRICGDHICYTAPPFSEQIDCPTDCVFTNITDLALIYHLQNDMVRPLRAGIQISNLTAICSLGAILTINGTKYGFTAGHCFDLNDVIYQPSDWIFNGTNWINMSNVTRIGTVTYDNDSIDIAMITFDDGIQSESIDYMNNTVDCIMDDFPNSQALVYKIGRTTGLTFGNLSLENAVRGDFYLATRDGIAISALCLGEGNCTSLNESLCMANINCTWHPESPDTDYFSVSGDSGSGLVIVGVPRKLIGFIYGGAGGMNSSTSWTWRDIETLKAEIPNLPICEHGYYSYGIGYV